MKEVKRIDEYTNVDGVITEIQIIFADGSKVTYEAEAITRKGNL